MKLKKIIFFVLLILSFSKLQAKAKMANFGANTQNCSTVQLDSIREEYNLKKKNTSELIKGKSSDDMLTYYTFYLQEKDISRADSIISAILKSAFYELAPDSLLKKQMGNHYNSLAWYSILTQKLNDVEYYLNQSIKYNPNSNYPCSNRPLLLLLKGRYAEARKLYVKLKDQPFDGPGSKYKDEFLIDFRELAAVGITNNDIKKIIKLLN